MDNKIAWTDKISNDIWHGGPCDTIAECIEEAKNEGYNDEDLIAFGNVIPYIINDINGDQIIEYLQEMAWDKVGEVSEDWLNDITLEQRKDLESRILSTVKEWLKSCNEEPSFYTVEPYDELTIKEAIEKYVK